MSLRYEPVEVILTEDQLAELCAEWQYRLRLVDWQIKLRLRRRSGMCHEHSGGEVDWLDTLKSAVISVLDPIDFDPDAVYPYDHERILVHELLHLHFAPFRTSDDSPEDTAQEVAIELMAQAFVQLKRERKPE